MLQFYYIFYTHSGTSSFSRLVVIFCGSRISIYLRISFSSRRVRERKKYHEHHRSCGLLVVVVIALCMPMHRVLLVWLNGNNKQQKN